MATAIATPSTGNETSKPDEESYKHPLEHSWTLWYYRNDKNKTWEGNLCNITSFSTVEDFWCLFNHLKSPSELTLGTDYYLFKKGIRPMWEDPANKRGGRWLICIDKKHGMSRTQKTDEYWLELVLLMIGQNFGDYNDELCGLTVNVRPKMDKIGVWTANAAKSNEEANKFIGETVKRELRMPRDYTIYFQTHSESAKKANLNVSMYRI